MTKKRMKIGWMESGDQYRIVGGDWEKQVGLDIILTIKEKRVSELWRLRNEWKEEKKYDELIHRLEGPFEEEEEKGAFGREFLKDHARRVSQTRLHNEQIISIG
jgi:hypothetical protein